MAAEGHQTSFSCLALNVRRPPFTARWIGMVVIIDLEVVVVDDPRIVIEITNRNLAVFEYCCLPFRFVKMLCDTETW